MSFLQKFAPASIWTRKDDSAQPNSRSSAIASSIKDSSLVTTSSFVASTRQRRSPSSTDFIVAPVELQRDGSTNVGRSSKKRRLDTGSLSSETDGLTEESGVGVFDSRFPVRVKKDGGGEPLDQTTLWKMSGLTLRLSNSHSVSSDEAIIVEAARPEDTCATPKVVSHSPERVKAEVDSVFVNAGPSSNDQPFIPLPTKASPRSALSSRKEAKWSSVAWTTAERHQREEQIAAKTSGWRKADAKLYRELMLKSLKPSLPTLWRSDFPGWPKAIFTSKYDNAVIKARNLGKGNSDFHGVRALKRLFDMGPRVRDCLARNSPLDLVMKTDIELFLRWTLQDAGLWKNRPYLPLLTIHCASGRMDLEVARTQLVHKMTKLQDRWNAALRHCEDPIAPPLYGILIVHTIIVVIAPVNIGVLCRNSPNELNGKNLIHVLHMCDFSKPFHDTFNTIAVAMVAIHCRDMLLEVLEGRELTNVCVDIDNEDPDA